MPAWLTALLRVPTDVAEIRMIVGAIPTRLNRIEELIMATAAEYATRIDAATTALATELTDFKQQLTDALNQAGAAGDSAVQAALSQLDGPISRLEKLGTPEGDVPVDPADDEGDATL